MAKRTQIVDYETEYWCGVCGVKVKHGNEVYVNDGRPRCPNGTCHRILRRNPHSHRSKRN